MQAVADPPVPTHGIVSASVARCVWQRFVWIGTAILLFSIGGCVGAGGFVRMEPADDPPPPDTTLAYSVFLIGDGGAPRVDILEPTLRLLRTHLLAAGEHSAVLFLGDNIYPSGLPPQNDPWREEAERRMDVQLSILEDYEGRIIFLPGNHDWGGEGLGGNPAALARQENYIEAALDRGNVYLPDNQFPGPAEVRVNDWLTIVALDTQWWFEPGRRYGDTGTYTLDQEATVLVELHDVLERNRHRDVVVAAHHPVFSNGAHGGRFTGSRRFPLHSITRRYLGTPQDLSHFRYRQLRESLLSVFNRHEGLLYAAGHEHNLQYFRYGDQHYVVSGSGTKLSYVEEQGGGISFGATEQGFAVVDYYADGSTWLSFWIPEGDGQRGRLIYRAQIQEPGSSPVPERRIPRRQAPEPGELAVDVDTTATAPSEVNADSLMARASPAEDPDEQLEPLETEEEPFAFYTQGTVTMAPGPEYQVGPLRRFLFGTRYRDVWATPVEIPIIDLKRTAGGLVPLRRGGGLQTVSLHLQGGDGDQYVLRSINKDPSRSLPAYIERTLAQDVVQDQISAMHPYAAFVLPPMLDSAGIFHTEPRLVYVPDDPKLGMYRDEFGGMIALFETRPDEEQEDEARFGFAENLIGSLKLFEEVEEDNDERVDERAFARARLFDMWIGDWDRHKDQWRWAEFDITPGKVYKPVPRDRDFAMFKFDGFLPRLARFFGPLAARRFTNFERGFHDVLGLNYNGAAMDRRFTSSLTRQDWIEIADSLQATLTDSVIISGLQRWPEPIFAEHAERTLRILQDRREELPGVAEEYYGHLAEVVDIVGSDKHERFEVRRLNNRQTEVVMYKTKKEGDIDRELLRRTFSTGETDEIRLYGLGGHDQFIVTGEGRNNIRIRAIGGSEEDVFVDETTQGHTHFYDTDTGNQFEVSRRTHVYTSSNPGINNYEMLRFEVDAFDVRPFVEYNADDAVLLGGGMVWVKQGFRKVPYAARHSLRANYAFRTGAYNIAYDGILIERWNGWDGWLHASLLTPHTFDNFFGFGNETPNTDERRQLFSSRLSNVTIRPEISREIIPFLRVRLAPHFSYWNVEQPDDWIPPVDGVGLAPEHFTDTYFAGAMAGATIGGLDTLAATRYGFLWDNSLELNVGVRHADERFVRFASDMRYYYTFTRWPWLTLAFRVGGASNFGSFRFYQANTLGNRENLRGFVRTRFSGHSNLYQNFDARVRLGDVNLYLTRGEFGVFGFIDHGRVWAGSDSKAFVDFFDPRRWHQGAGGGIWFSPFNQVVMTTGVEASNENVLFDFSLDFFF